ncbi:hypothetical protein [Gemmatimonas sp.]|uniref:hypothetical protein n=1 Tax=Gemmatimonas sp. TaxID=1962908 RepID=UPI003F70EB5C
MIVHLDHPNAQQVRRAAVALGDLVREVVFVGGQMVPFFITDRGLHRLRPTDDVDVVVACRTRHAYHEFAQRLQAVGFRVDQSPGAPVCRYRTTDGLVLDAMPLGGDILGFSNQWYPLVMDTAVSVDLTAGVVIRVAHPAALLATKWEAFLDRGFEDPFSSHDLEDLLMLIAGAPRTRARATLALTGHARIHCRLRSDADGGTVVRRRPRRDVPGCAAAAERARGNS